MVLGNTKKNTTAANDAAVDTRMCCWWYESMYYYRRDEGHADNNGGSLHNVVGCGLIFSHRKSGAGTSTIELTNHEGRRGHGNDTANASVFLCLFEITVEYRRTKNERIIRRTCSSIIGIISAACHVRGRGT